MEVWKMGTSQRQIASWLFAIDFFLVLSGLIGVMYAKTALLGYMLIFFGIVVAGIIAAMCAPPSSPHHTGAIADPREKKQLER